jgi:hypothetical protein
VIGANGSPGDRAVFHLIAHEFGGGEWNGDSDRSV